MSTYRNLSMHIQQSVFRILCFVLILQLGLSPQANAQQSVQSSIWITKVDTSEYPNVRVFVSGNNLPADIATLPVTLRENGVERSIESNEKETVGVQIALLLDSARAIANPGSTGDPQYVEAGLAARRLVSESVSKNWLSPETDWLTAIAYTSGAQVKVLKEWTRDHQAAADSLYTFNPATENLARRTGLFDLLFYSARSFGDSSPAETAGKNRAIVIFSDGFDSVSTTQLGDLSLASAQPIPVHTVMVGPDVAAQRQNLQRLALLTGGTFAQLRTGLQDVDPIWEAIAKTREQQVLTYRSQESQLREVSVSVRLPDGRTISASQPVPSVGVQKAQVRIDEPVNGQEIVREAPEYSTPLENLSNSELVIRTGIEWPNYPRDIRKVEYEVVGAGTIERTEAPFDEPMIFPIPQLDSGTYSLRVRVTDELGMVGESNVTSFSVVVRRPPPPTATPNATATAAATATTQALLNAQATSEAKAAAAESTAVAAAQAAAQGNAEVRATAEAVRLTAEADRIAAQSTAEALGLAQEAAANAAATANAEATASAAEARATAEVLEGQLTATTIQVQRLSWVSIASIAVAVIALGLAIYVLSNRDRRRRATEIVTGTVKAVTQPFVRQRRGKPLAKLVLVDSAGMPGIQATIPLREHATVRIGRDPDLVNVALNHQQVSRLHCRITDDAAGGFRVLDEGGPSGTYVNDEDVGMHGRILQPGDILAIGPIEYRFEIDSSDGRPSPDTEPYQRTTRG